MPTQRVIFKKLVSWYLLKIISFTVNLTEPFCTTQHSCNVKCAIHHAACWKSGPTDNPINQFRPFIIRSSLRHICQHAKMLSGQDKIA